MDAIEQPRCHVRQDQKDVKHNGLKDSRNQAGLSGMAGHSTRRGREIEDTERRENHSRGDAVRLEISRTVGRGQ